jgi:hypothetical protein
VILAALASAALCVIAVSAVVTASGVHQVSVQVCDLARQQHLALPPGC